MNEVKAGHWDDFICAPIHVFWISATPTARKRFTVLTRVYGYQPELTDRYPRFAAIHHNKIAGHGWMVAFGRNTSGFPSINLFNDGGYSMAVPKDEFKAMLVRAWLKEAA